MESWSVPILGAKSGEAAIRKIMVEEMGGEKEGLVE